MTIANSLPTSTHLITLPSASSAYAPTRLIAHLTLFEGPSALLWCGECSEEWTGNEGAAQGHPLQVTTSSLLIAEHHPSPTQSLSLAPITANLASEWAVSMTNFQTKATSATSLYRTNADLAKPMSSRLSKRFGLSQLYLSLFLPATILSSLDGPMAGAEGGRSLLMVEGALGDILRQATSS